METPTPMTEYLAILTIKVILALFSVVCVNKWSMCHKLMSNFTEILYVGLTLILDKKN